MAKKKFEQERKIKHGLRILATFRSLDKMVRRGEINKEEAIKHREQLCKEMQTVLKALRPKNEIRGIPYGKWTRRFHRGRRRRNVRGHITFG